MNIHKLHQFAAATPHAAPAPHPFVLTEVRRSIHNDCRRTFRTSVANYAYIMRVEIEDDLGPVPNDYLQKAHDLVSCGRRHPIQNIPVDLRAGPLIWQRADAAAALDEDDAASSIHVIVSLPVNGNAASWERVLTSFIDERLVALGMVVDWAIHCVRRDDGTYDVHPHAHLLASARRWKSDQRRGQRMKPWLSCKTQREALEDAWHAASGVPQQPLVAV